MNRELPVNTITTWIIALPATTGIRHGLAPLNLDQGGTICPQSSNKVPKVPWTIRNRMQPLVAKGDDRPLPANRANELEVGEGAVGLKSAVELSGNINRKTNRARGKYIRSHEKGYYSDKEIEKLTVDSNTGLTSRKQIRLIPCKYRAGADRLVVPVICAVNSAIPHVESVSC
ncbi:hypothetical protein M407DRAFT_22011 [Tulasnella calospora MUT 4182]|uniref:Uncharacterized protein n=1 Tax=Tulasnella calospora MUT 4182 TaxID=1051891 RepID=A0A0C3QNZ9_9AGAM|nr:hypothetical protein M407DRAFT_22011 [Tulasnella calospora MUT 4182]